MNFRDTLAFRNRNPLNMRYSRNQTWEGQIGESGGFVKFKEFYYGYRAAVIVLRNYKKRGIRSIYKIISTWAPPNENDTGAYIKTVVDFMKGRWGTEPREYDAKTLINLCDREEVVNFLMAMTKVEMGANGAQLHMLKSDIEWGYDKAVSSKGFFTDVNKFF